MVSVVEEIGEHANVFGCRGSVLGGVCGLVVRGIDRFVFGGIGERSLRRNGGLISRWLGVGSHGSDG